MKQFWEQYKLVSNLPKPAAFPTFWKVAPRKFRYNNDPAYCLFPVHCQLRFSRNMMCNRIHFPKIRGLVCEWGFGAATDKD